ncbi:MAG: tRNA 2-thiocytidine biosynthesis protein TtcA [Candidatus Latescibacteria bacterium]|nr:tRNA 2-thiocytidine biosynthesis protein TtcA [Candidatus Latescibacterota bacterium]
MSADKLKTRQYRHSPLTRYGRNLLRKVNRVIDEYGLIGDGDRVCVSVSGGKDSLSLLHLLLEHRRFYPTDYSLSAVHVVSDFHPNAARTKEYLRGMFESLGIEYGFINISVTTDERGNESPPDCFRCSWKRRKAVFSHCAEHGYNRLAFGHHYDDVAETTLLNLFFHGNLDTILPMRDFFDGSFTVIRPLFYLREKDLVRYAKMAGFETSSCACPNGENGKRPVMKRLVRSLTKESRLLHANLWRASRIWHETVGDRPGRPREKKFGADERPSEIRP